MTKNNLTIDGNDNIIAKFKSENFDEEGLKFSKLLPVPVELNDELYIQTWKIENWGTRNELDKKGFEYLREEDNTFSFETFMYPPLLWVTKAAEKYPKISFILTFSQSVHNFSGFVTYKKGKCIAQKIGKDGDHYGRKHCEYCDKYINYNKAKEEYDNNYEICVECRDKELKKITDFVREKREREILEMRKKVARMRIGRNAIMDNYIMRKIFINRLYEPAPQLSFPSQLVLSVEELIELHDNLKKKREENYKLINNTYWELVD